jgi:2-polyprenyl-3-methyl-5-hydroxy-6-metoxy-1,4-benzoquinol methylase
MLDESYQQKETAYYQHARTEMRPFVPQGTRVLLDVGCGRGSFSRYFKEAHGTEVWGVEMMPDAAGDAAKTLDRALCGEFNPALALPQAYFDVITFNDVLEHMIAPEEAVQYARTLLRPGGVVVASMPNFLYGHNLREILGKRDWQYRDDGILDRTHLRFFTRKSMVRLFEENGFAVERCEGINAFYTGRTFRLVNWLCRRRFDEMRWLQFALVARPR